MNCDIGGYKEKIFSNETWTKESVTKYMKNIFISKLGSIKRETIATQQLIIIFQFKIISEYIDNVITE